LLAGAPAQAQDDDLIVVGSSSEIEEQRRRNAPPALVVTPEAIVLAAEGGTVEPERLVIRNAGGRSLDWRASVDTPVISLDPSEGRLGHGEECEVQVRVDVAALTPGRTRAGIAVEAPGAAGSPKVIAVAVSVPVPEPSSTGSETGAVDRPGDDVDAGTNSAQTRAPAAGIRDASRRPLCVRVGLLVPGKGDTQDYDLSMLLGLAYSPARREGAKMSYELGSEFVRAKGSGSDTYSNVAIARADVLFGNGRKAYLLSGLEGYAVDYEGDVLFSGGVGVGAGMRLAGGRFDVRLRHSLLLGSTNLRNVTLFALGASF
jgi:hypothetical protein